MAEGELEEITAQIPLRHRIVGRMASAYAHNLLIQPAPEAVVLSFFETIMPLKPDITPADIEELKKVGVVSECVARITMSPQAFLEASAAMQRVAKLIQEGLRQTEE